MSDHSAVALIGLLLSRSTDDSIPLMEETLGKDPPLALWAACMAGELAPRLHPRSLTDLARWLTEVGVEILRWEQEEDCGPPAWGDSDSVRLADRVEEHLQVADLAALSATAQGQQAAEEAYLAGLVHGGRQWLVLAGGSTDEPAIRMLECLAGLNRAPTCDHVTQALEILAGRRPAESLEAELSGARERAAQRGRRWQETLALADRLPILAEKLRRLGRLERQFQETLEAEKLAAMAEFAAGAGHEINNPLAVIGGRAQLFLREETDPERRRELALMNAQVKRAYEMIADMRLFARPPKPEPVQFDLIPLVDRLLADMASQAADRAIILCRTGDPGPVSIYADPVQIHVALRALCTNSLEAIGREGRVEIAIHPATDGVAIQVIDNGPGILPEHRRHIFDPFFSARQAGRGLGLGLSKCWRIVTNHRGRIEVDSQPGRGAVFTVTLPGRLACDQP